MRKFPLVISKREINMQIQDLGRFTDFHLFKYFYDCHVGDYYKTLSAQDLFNELTEIVDIAVGDYMVLKRPKCIVKAMNYHLHFQRVILKKLPINYDSDTESESEDDADSDVDQGYNSMHPCDGCPEGCCDCLSGASESESDSQEGQSESELEIIEI